MNKTKPQVPLQTDDELRINRYLAQCGLGSRRSCETLIRNGRVILNDKVVTDLGTKVDPVKDTIVLDGKVLSRIALLEYLAFHKPRGIVVTASDPEGRETLYDFIAADHKRDIRHMKYVGRLDVDSEGLLLLTNDGSLVHALTHPRFHVKKVYHAFTETPLSPEEQRTLVQDGVESEGQLLCAGEVNPLSQTARGYWTEVVLYEGKRRQVRRLFDAVGHQVIRLLRVQFGGVKLDDLPPGGLRPLTEREVGGLKATGYRVEGRQRVAVSGTMKHEPFGDGD